MENVQIINNFQWNVAKFKNGIQEIILQLVLYLEKIETTLRGFV